MAQTPARQARPAPQSESVAQPWQGPPSGCGEHGGPQSAVQRERTQVSKPVPQSASAASEILPELESLRGIAISLVVLLHAEGMINGLRAFAAPWLSPWRAYVLGGPFT